jgi:peroxiredoxin
MQKLKLFTCLFACLTLFFAGTISSGYQIGDTVSNFKLKNTDGKFVSLSDYQSKKGVIVIFDCNTCPYSKAYNERILALDKKYASKDIPVLVINSNDPNISPGDSFEQMVKQAKDKKYSFPYLIDESQEVAKNFGATNTPHVFVLAKNGDAFKVAYIGAIDNNSKDAKGADKKYVEDAVDAILAGNEIKTNKTKAIGCTIKWKNV